MTKKTEIVPQEKRKLMVFLKDTLIGQLEPA
jgi:hypothetical protein